MPVLYRGSKCGLGTLVLHGQPLNWLLIITVTSLDASRFCRWHSLIKFTRRYSLTCDIHLHSTVLCSSIFCFRYFLLKSNMATLPLVLIYLLPEIKRLTNLSLHRAFWYSHSSFTNRCTFIKTLITICIKLDGSYTFRSTTIIRELAIEPG